MLTGKEIQELVMRGEIDISPFDKKRLNPNSYNLCLGRVIKTYTEFPLDPRKLNPCLTTQYHFGDAVLLEPGKLYLASTVERTYARDLIPCISGRSGVARLGITVHQTAGFGDIGFNGTWTLEISCIHPVYIIIGMEICQIYFEKPDGDTSMKYHGSYQGQTEPKVSYIQVP